jgi:hypothetical protein
MQHSSTPKISGDAECKAIPGSPSNAIAAWISFAGTDVHWTLPTAAGTRTARALAERAIADASAEVEVMISSGAIRDMGHASRRRLRRAQLLAYVTLCCLQDVLPPFCLAPGVAEAKGSEGEGALCICSMRFSGWENYTGLEQTLDLALRIAQHADPANVHCMTMVIAMIEVRFEAAVQSVRVMVAPSGRDCGRLR